MGNARIGQRPRPRAVRDGNDRIVRSGITRHTGSIATGRGDVDDTVGVVEVLEDGVLSRRIASSQAHADRVGAGIPARNGGSRQVGLADNPITGIVEDFDDVQLRAAGHHPDYTNVVVHRVGDTGDVGAMAETILPPVLAGDLRRAGGGDAWKSSWAA